MIRWLRKELREHWVALIGWSLAAAAVLGLQLASWSRNPGRGSWLEVAAPFTVAWLLLGTPYLAGRLIRREYNSRTQLFLEALPVGRATVLATKWALGALLTVGAVAVAIAVLASLEASPAPQAGRISVAAFVRLGTVALSGWALLALGGVLGRYRIPFLLLLFLSAFLLDSSTGLDLRTMGPVRLVGEDLAFSPELPVESLWITWGAIAGLAAATFALVLIREGTLTLLLSDRMSHREKVFIGCVFFAVIIASSLLDAAKQKQQFRLEEAIRATEGGTTVELDAAPDLAHDTAEATAQALARDLAKAIGFLGLEGEHRVSVLSSRELDPDEVQRAAVMNARGVVMRANVEHAAFKRADVEELALHELLTDRSPHLLTREPRHWVLDAFSVWMPARDDAGALRRLRLRAAYAAREGATPEQLLRWDTFFERHGRCVAMAYAAHTLQVLQAHAGEAKTQRFLRAVLAGPATKWPWFPGAATPVDRALEDETGLDRQALFAAVQADLQAAAAEVAALPRASATLVVEPERGSTRTFALRHQLALEPPPPAPVRYSLRYTSVGPFDDSVSGTDVHEARANDPAPARLPRTLVRGERWFWAVDLPSDLLGCQLRVLAERREIR